jgi:hypothetical protein
MDVITCGIPCRLCCIDVETIRVMEPTTSHSGRKCTVALLNQRWGEVSNYVSDRLDAVPVTKLGQLPNSAATVGTARTEISPVVLK